MADDPNSPPRDHARKPPTVPRRATLTTDSIRRIEAMALARVGKLLADRFMLNRVLAIGGMATVYQATQAPLMRQVAVKILHPTEIEAGRTDFFLREANAASTLRHPNIIQIVDFGQEDDGTLFLAMEYVPGQNLGELLEQEFPLSWERVCSIAGQVCLALEVAHRAGVVHCDMKPSNVMVESLVGNPDFVKVVDFGISRIIQIGDDVPEASREDDQVFGSFNYMAPEIILGNPVVPETDLYGVGATLYAALTGTMPFSHLADDEILVGILSHDLAPPSEVQPTLGIPGGLDDVVRRAMAKAPTDRFRSAADMRTAILRLFETPYSSSEMDALSSLEMILPREELFRGTDSDNKPLCDGYLVDPWQSDTELARPLGRHTRVGQVTHGATDAEIRSSSSSLHPRAGQVQPLSDAAQRIVDGWRGLGPLIGRKRALMQVRDALIRSRRGALSLFLSGPYGSGRSAFLDRVLDIIRADHGAEVLRVNLLPGDRERPYYTLWHWVREAVLTLYGRLYPATQQELPAFTARERDDGLFTSAPSFAATEPEPGEWTRDLLLAAIAAPRKIRAVDLLALDLGDIEADTLASLLARWDTAEGAEETEWDRDPVWAYPRGPLRFPETRRHLLLHAFHILLRRLAAATTSAASAPTSIVIAVDGWEHCDSASRDVLRALLREGRNLPLLVMGAGTLALRGSSEPLSEEGGAPQGRRNWWDIEVAMTNFSRAEVRDYLAHHTGGPVSDTFLNRVVDLSAGNPLFVRELMALLTRPGPQTVDESRVLRPLPELPTDLTELFRQRIADLSIDGKMLLAVAAVMGNSVPQAALRAALPGDFDFAGALAELIGGRELEPEIESRDARVRFVLPHLRELALRRIKDRHLAALHSRVADLIADGRIPLRSSEADVAMARHRAAAGAPMGGIDVILDAGGRAAVRWEPELAMRRCRQAQLLVAQQLTAAKATGADREAEVELDLRAVRATMGLLAAARRLDIKPSRGGDAVVSEELPLHFLDHLGRPDSGRLPVRLLAEAALETGRYLADSNMPQSAQRALHSALAFAEAEGSEPLVAQVQLQLARVLHCTGDLDGARLVADEVLEHLTVLDPPPPVDQRRAELYRSQPAARLGAIDVDAGAYTRADARLLEAIQLARSDGNANHLQEVLVQRAALHQATGRSETAQELLQQALEAAQRADNLRAQARILYDQGVAAVRRREPMRAQGHLAAAQTIAVALGWGDLISLVENQARLLAAEFGAVAR